MDNLPRMGDGNEPADSGLEFDQKNQIERNENLNNENEELGDKSNQNDEDSDGIEHQLTDRVRMKKLDELDEEQL